MADAPDDDAGWEVARAAAEHAAAELGERLASAYAIGSLAHGGFSPLVSDVDVTLLVDRWDEGVAARLAAVAPATQRQLGAGLADRLSIFYCDWPSLSDPPSGARMGAIDRLDLIENGVLIRGVDRRDTYGIRPSREELVAETADFLARSVGAELEPGALIAAGPRTLTKTVLFPVRFLYTHATGRAGANADAVRWYRDSGGRHAALAEAALTWRSGTVDAPVARMLLEAHLEPLYEECRRAFEA
jgi:hypothetical protein